jgi:hypothetical protein
VAAAGSFGGSRGEDQTFAREQRDASGARIKWLFTTEPARCKPAGAYSALGKEL